MHQHTPKGKVYLVGAGPGDPSLLTIRGQEILSRADVVLYDSLANPVLLDLAPVHAEKLNVGKRAGHHLVPQSEIHALLADRVAAGKTVVRLKGGDPILFGRGAEEASFLFSAGISFDIVPGVPSALAVPIYAGIPVTHRDLASSVTIVTGHARPDQEGNPIDWPGLVRTLKHRGTLVILMGLKSLPSIVQHLLGLGAPPETPAATIVSGTYARQKRVVGTLSQLPELVTAAGLKPPALTIVGAVVEEWPHLDWFQSKPFFGKRFVVTRPRDQAEALSTPLRELGGEVVELPVISIRPMPRTPSLSRAVRRAKEYDWIVFTSPNGVRHFLQNVLDEFGDIRQLHGPRLAAIGPGTATALREFHLPCDLVPDSAYQQEGLLEAFEAAEGNGGPDRTVLLPRAREARSVLPDGLRKRGWKVDVHPVYETVPTPPEEMEGALQAIHRFGADWVAFTSSSTVTYFARLLESKVLMPIPGNVRYASIGPITTETAIECGLHIDAEAEKSTIEGVIDALMRHI